METQAWKVGESDFTVDTAGPPSGAPVLLLHGFPQNRRMWRYQLEALAAAAGFLSIAPDQRGYSAGARPAEVESYASELLTADALGLMDHCGADRFHLVGHDWGGQLAWLIAAGNPARVATLTVLSRPHPTRSLARWLKTRNKPSAPNTIARFARLTRRIDCVRMISKPCETP